MFAFYIKVKPLTILIGHEIDKTFCRLLGTSNITSIPKEIKATRGQSIQLRCKAKGYPVPLKVSWSKDGTSIPYNQRQVVSVDNTLLIDSVQREDAGRYKCIAVNGANKEDERFVEVTVNGEYRSFKA